MSNCSHEAWDFGALQCPDCGAVKGHVADADYAKLEAEAQALREEVERGNRITVAMALDISAVGEALGIPGEEQEGGTGEFIDLIRELQKEVAALRARVVVVPERRQWGGLLPTAENLKTDGFNACLDELARLNGLTVSEGLLRRIVTPALTSSDAQDRIGELEELRALLSEYKENGDHAA
ncbi:hypothetical protein JTM19_29880 [Pseudomonas aeruginosa]|nr:hypothetical protein [Pseudomonas aeruginosa]MBN0682334.1 hypothetical protein [Pseudomonas aeruginosa]